MKKLMMFAAAVTIAGGAFAQCGDLPEIPEVGCALIYDLKGSLKSTAAKSSSYEVECGDPEDVCYRVPASLKMAGFIYTCDCCLYPEADALVWFGKSDTAYVVPVDFEILNLIGKKMTDVEALLGFGDEYAGFDFVAGGFGKWSQGKNDYYGYVSSVSGQIVGMVEPPACAASCEDPIPAVAYPACDFIGTSEVWDVATGTWSMKANKKMSEQALVVSERLVLTGKLPKQIRYIVEDGSVYTVASWVLGSSI